MGVSKDLAAERLKSTFIVEELTFALYGRDGTRRRRTAFKRASEDPEFAKSEKFAVMDRDDVYDEAVRMEMVAALRIREYGYDEPTATADNANFIQAAFIGSHPFMIHSGGFIPSIKGQGTPEQIAEFLTKSENLEYVGTYCQTEIGHGSFVRGLETTATYDRQNQQFILDTPQLSSLKFWPGGLGRSSNYVVLMAQLVIDGKKYGVHPFMCQLRDIETHEPLPGVEVGDINSKFNFNASDNGYMRLTGHRIPRTHMLMRYAQVLPDGTYTRQDVPPQVAYLSMSNLRTAIVAGCASELARAVTIATRYSAVRRQTANSQGVEPQILDYQTQQMKLFPAICAAYALHFSGAALMTVYNDTVAAVNKGDLSRLPEMHYMTSGLKAFAADTGSQHIETCRRSCGGHGYSHASGIPTIYGLNTINSTAEGESTVLYLQVARSLMKYVRKAESGESLPATMSFLSESPILPPYIKSAQRFNLDLYSEMFKLNVLCLTRRVADQIYQSVASGSVDAQTAFTNNSVKLVEAAMSYAQYMVVKLFIDAIAGMELEANVKKVMLHVCEFNAVHNLVDSSGQFLQNGIVTPDQVSVLRQRRTELLTELRPNAVTLVDAFDYPDRLLNSCLGRYDGNVYEALYEYAKSSSLNQHQVHPSYHKYIKPMQQAMRAKL